MNDSAEKLGDTIVACSTPRGYSGIGVIRMSGSDALRILGLIFQPSNTQCVWPDRRAVYGRVVAPENGKVLDDGLALAMRGPHSFTGEDVVELYLHGSPMILEMVEQAIVRQGARPADRGEFTRRAFLSGRIDLVQAEAVIDLIESRSPAAAEEARARLDEGLSVAIRSLSDALKDLVASTEAHIDFDEDDEVPAPDPLPAIRHILDGMQALKRNSEALRLRRDGLSVVIVGKPNVGKSTLFNALLEVDRVIVTPYPGTTRDPVDEYLLLEDLAILLCDTAGIRHQPDPIEAEGIRRTRQKIDRADLVIAVLDGTAFPDEEDAAVLELCRERETVVVLNKIDLGLAGSPSDWGTVSFSEPALPISAKTGEGLEDLKHVLARVGAKKTMMETLPTPAGLNRRGMLLVEAAALPVAELLSRLERGERIDAEILSLELRRSLEPLEEITGERVDDGVLDRIFERFCVGK